MRYGKLGVLACILILASCGEQGPARTKADDPSDYRVGEDPLIDRNTEIRFAVREYAETLSIMDSFGAPSRCIDAYVVNSAAVKDARELQGPRNLLVEIEYDVSKVGPDPKYIGTRCYGLDLRYGEQHPIGARMMGVKQYHVSQWDSGWRVDGMVE